MNPYQPPKPSLGDAAHALIRGALDDIVPVVGGTAAELFSFIVQAPLEQRRDAWMGRVGDDLCRLKVRIENLRDDPVFIDTLLHASQAALKTGQEEKLEALRNAVLNAALPQPPDESKQQMFVRLIDDFTFWHLRILRFLDRPPTYYEAAQRQMPRLDQPNYRELLRDAFSELRDETDFCEMVVADLFAKRLVHVKDMREHTNDQALAASRTTQLGREFLAIISEPTPRTSH